VCGGEGDGAAAEAGAGEPGAEDAWCLDGDGDEGVEFRSAHLVVVAQTAVRLVHQVAELVDSAVTQALTPSRTR
jgi:hypothetical protein